MIGSAPKIYEYTSLHEKIEKKHIDTNRHIVDKIFLEGKDRIPIHSRNQYRIKVEGEKGHLV